jgi:nitroimidazol reductase NimA-like FMN-containing flavoprotein (pyridoxamine 5'-phosphate oxidase superfamily)
VRDLSRDEIEDFLCSQRIARLGCHAEGEIYVVPVIYAYEDGALVTVTQEGRKVSMLRANPRVCVEVDEYDADSRGSWRSVIAYGDAEELEGDEIEAALALLRDRFARSAGRSAPARTLSPSTVVLRIQLDEVSGRAVER